MKKQLVLAACALLAVPALAAAQHAVEVVSYNPGLTPAVGFLGPFTDPTTALGRPEILTGDAIAFPGAVSAFNPLFQPDEAVSIGEGGSLTLRLSNFAEAGPGPEIGFFTNVGLVDVDGFDNNTATAGGSSTDPPPTFGVDDALVEVSENGVTFFSLDVQTFDIPTQAFANAAANFLSDPTLPFTSSLDSFAGLPFADPTDPDVLDVFAGSAGGTWLDIEPSGLTRVGFVRLSVPSDGIALPNVDLNFELDAVSIASRAIGVATVPEPSALVLALVGCAFTTRRRRQG